MSGEPARRRGHLTIVPPRTHAEVWADWKARAAEMAAEEAAWLAEEARISAQEQAVTRLLLGALGMFCLGVVLMSLWPLAVAAFGGAP